MVLASLGYQNHEVKEAKQSGGRPESMLWSYYVLKIITFENKSVCMQISRLLHPAREVT